MTRTIRTALAGGLSLAALSASADTIGSLAHADAAAVAEDFERIDEFTIEVENDLLAMPPENEDGTINALVEIPAGTSAKWEVGDDTTQIIWEEVEDGPRIVRYLAYPGNYGTIPSTALPEALGGDGDPLDVIVLGQAAPRGAQVPARLIGVLKMTDQGQQDDKLLAVMTEDSPFSGIESIAQMQEEFPGAAEIVSTWFTNYKGPDGGMENEGFGDVGEAREIFDQAVANYTDEG